MGLIHIDLFTTLDGVAQAPGGPDEDPADGFAFGGWQAPLIDEVVGEQVVSGMAGMDALLLGRRTYDIFAAYWPHADEAEVQRPLRELRGFEKIYLEPGEMVRVEFTLENRDFAYWDALADGGEGRPGLWRREGGEFRIEIGASSRDIRLNQAITLPGDPTIPPLIPDAESQLSATSRFVQGHSQ